MKLALKFADLLPEIVRNELQQLLARTNKVWTVEHDPQTGQHRFPTTQSTVGAAGSASALPANPVRYASITYLDGDGVTQTGVIPIYDPE